MVGLMEDRMMLIRALASSSCGQASCVHLCVCVGGVGVGVGVGWGWGCVCSRALFVQAPRRNVCVTGMCASLECVRHRNVCVTGMCASLECVRHRNVCVTCVPWVCAQRALPLTWIGPLVVFTGMCHGCWCALACAMVAGVCWHV